jgi:hypothetical protein
VKKFAFPLERVLEWRRTQARVEQAKLQQMLGELRQLEERASAIQQERGDSERAVIQSRSSLGLELAALQHFRTSSTAQSAVLAREGSAHRERIRVQREVAALKERDVRLLEKLREDRFEVWRRAQEHDIDQQAEEAFLGRWLSGADRRVGLRVVMNLEEAQGQRK